MSASLLETLFTVPKHSTKTIAQAVLKLSDFYIHNPTDPTPWKDEFCKVAYRHYYLPLNFIRNQLVVRRGQEVGFFSDIDHAVDWGCGPATASLALSEIKKIRNYLLIDRAAELQNEFADLWRNYLKNQGESQNTPRENESHNLSIERRADGESLTKMNYSFKTEMASSNLPRDLSRSLLVCSYSLTEKNSLPKGWENFEALMILEPSTQEDGRSLLHLREQLIKNGFAIWAPCLHQQTCPLLAESKRDWCHDRAHVNAPKWFLDLENDLPMRNRTVTTSYLLARKGHSQSLGSKSLHSIEAQDQMRESGWVRLIGDPLIEKGKTRQLICRSSKREFLAWMHKTGTPPELNRGDFYQLPEDPEDYTLISNEIRIKK